MIIYKYITKKKLEKEIVIKLIDNEFVNCWKKYLIRISNKCPKVNWYFTGLNNSAQSQNFDKNRNYLSQLKNNFLYFHNLQVEDYFEVLKELDFLILNQNFIKQYNLNFWHREFTKLETKYLKLGEPIPKNVNKIEFWQNIQDINGFTHRLENITYPKIEKRQKFLDVLQYSIQFTNAMNLAGYNKGDVFDAENIEHITNFKFDFFHEDYDYTVWMHEDITGKDQMKAWLDDDNLNEPDITGNLLWTPNVTFDPYKIYYRILNDLNFRVQSKNSKKSIDRYPLGNIVNIESIIWNEIFESTITNVTLDNNVLWSQ